MSGALWIKGWIQSGSLIQHLLDQVPVLPTISQLWPRPWPCTGLVVTTLDLTTALVPAPCMQIGTLCPSRNPVHAGLGPLPQSQFPALSAMWAGLVLGSVIRVFTPETKDQDPRPLCSGRDLNLHLFNLPAQCLIITPEVRHFQSKHNIANLQSFIVKSSSKLFCSINSMPYNQ